MTSSRSCFEVATPMLTVLGTKNLTLHHTFQGQPAPANSTRCCTAPGFHSVTMYRCHFQECQRSIIDVTRLENIFPCLWMSIPSPSLSVNQLVSQGSDQLRMQPSAAGVTGTSANGRTYLLPTGTLCSPGDSHTPALQGKSMNPFKITVRQMIITI